MKNRPDFILFSNNFFIGCDSSLPVSSDTEFERVNSVVNSLTDEQSSSIGMSVIQSQGMYLFDVQSTLCLC